MRRKCPASRRILAELAADIALARYLRTRSHGALYRLRAARLAALEVAT